MIADGSTPDRVTLALASIVAGAATGASIVVLGMLTFRTLQTSGTDVSSGPPLLSGPLFAGLVCAGVAAWVLGRPIADTWQRGLTAALATFGAAILAALAAPADMIGQRPGLAVYFVLLLAGAAFTWRAARRAAAG